LRHCRIDLKKSGQHLAPGVSRRVPGLAKDPEGFTFQWPEGSAR
jgi:hypothetical protein